MWFVLFAAATARAVTPAVVVGPDLQPRRVNLQSVGDDAITFFDAKRVYQSEPTSRVVQLRDFDADAKTPPATQPAAAAIELVDGQRFVGTLDSTSPDGQVIRWRHAALGVVSANLERVRSITFQTDNAAPAANPAPQADRLRLTNGDTLEGFVSALSDKGVTLKPASAQAVTLPLDRVAALTLTNPAEARTPPAGERFVTLRDGSSFRSARFTLTGGEARVAPLATAAIDDKTRRATGGPVETALPAATLASVEFASAAGRLVPLASLPIEFTGGAAFGVQFPRRAAPGLIAVHAPVRLDITLPPGAARLALEARFDAPPRDAVVNPDDWRDCLIIAYDGDKPAGRWRINGKNPAAEINVPLTSKSLRLDIEPGANGPTLDRVRLLNPVVLVQPNATP